MAADSRGFLASSARFVQPDGTATPEFRTFLQSIYSAGGNLTAIAAQAAAAVAASTAAVATANNALAQANASLKKAQNLADLVDAAVARDNLGLGSIVLGDTQPGWADPTGAGSRATFNMNLLLPVSNPPTQAEVTAIAAQVIVLQKRMGQTVLDLKTATVLGS